MGPNAPFADVRVGMHRVMLLRDGAQAFPAMLAAIEGASSTVCLETYILSADSTGDRFAAALAERARAGVEVNLLYDAWGSWLPRTYLDTLTRSGVRVRAYHPLRVTGRLRETLGRLTHRDHRKVLVVDGEVGFAGGINISNEYDAAATGRFSFRDTHIGLTGPAARELQYFFLHTWNRIGGAPTDDSRYASRLRSPDPLVQVVTSHRRHGRTAIREAYRGAIRTATQSVLITNPYFLPSLRFLAELLDARGRGVDVRVMVAGTTDSTLMLHASRSVYGLLLASGVRIYEWEGRVLHAKTAVVDGHWATIGSSNLDAQSLRMNLEVNVIVRDPPFARQLERMFEADLLSCREVTREAWQTRTTLARALSFGAQLFRRWL